MSDFDVLWATLGQPPINAQFAEPITYTPLSGPPEIVQMIPIPPSQMDGLDPGRYIVRWAQESAFAVQPTRGGQLTIDGMQYTVFEIRHDMVDGLFLIANR